MAAKLQEKGDLKQVVLLIHTNAPGGVLVGVLRQREHEPNEGVLSDQVFKPDQMGARGVKGSQPNQVVADDPSAGPYTERTEFPAPNGVESPARLAAERELPWRPMDAVMGNIISHD
jgi:hypothetical protein